jgi:hypothetical protein
MKNSWLANALATPPAVPSLPSVGYPTGGDPATSTPATNPGAYWFHMITMELLNVITAAGLTPDASNLTQLKAALDALYAGAGGALTTGNFTGSNQSLASNGYQKLPGGLILQWGSISMAFPSTTTVTFPVAFPNACLNSQISVLGYTGVIETYGCASSITATNFSLDHNWIGDAAGNPNDPSTINWVAIGH